MIQSIHCHFNREAVLLDLDSHLETPEEIEDLSIRRKQEFIRSILEIQVGLLEKSGNIVNPSKCLKDMFHRELKHTTAMGSGLAMPHVRTLQAKELVISVMRSKKGQYFNSLDQMPVHVFIGILAPPYEDRKYLKLISELSNRVLDGSLFESIMGADNPDEVMSYFCRR